MDRLKGSILSRWEGVSRGDLAKDCLQVTWRRQYCSGYYRDYGERPPDGRMTTRTQEITWHHMPFRELRRRRKQGTR